MGYRRFSMNRVLMEASWVFAIAGLLALSPCGRASAQGGASSTADIAAYAGPDRAERLIAGAKKEGTVTVYTSANVDDMAVVTSAFEKKYGVKVRVWRGSSETLVQRSVTEARGGRYDADVFETGGAAMESLHREKLLQEVKSPNFADLDPAALSVRPKTS
jgi:iron(III) transport system substrate-binding protein